MRNYTIQKLKELDINPNVILSYDEPHRFYHNWIHIETMLQQAKQRDILTDELFLAIVFHDITYDPKAKDNEERSAKVFCSCIKNDEVKQAILDTKTHQSKTQLSKNLCDLDLKVLYSDYKSFIDFEHNIFKEYQFVPYEIYKEKRIEILYDYAINPEWINYVKNRTPKIAVYAGSFNPFHKGHFNILQKAEQIFDKVIIARGINPDKSNEFCGLPSQIQYRQIENYDGLLTDFINELNYDVTLIRGLRNATDLEYELNQYRFLQDLKPEIKVVSIFCDKEFEHISSSACRMLKKYNKQDKYLL